MRVNAPLVNAVSVVLAYAAAVLFATLMSGATSTVHPRSASGRGRTVWPRSCARQVPPWRKKLTSEPRRAAIPDSSSRDRPSPQRALSPRSTAAASLLPPPSPAATGTLLSRTIRAPPACPVTSASMRAARSAKLSSDRSSGTAHSNAISSWGSRLTVSHRSTAWMTDATSW